MDFFAENPWVIVLVVVMLVDIPLLLGVLMWLRQRKVRSAQNWIMTFGKIVVSEVRVRKNSRRNRVYYSPYIVYEYEVMGTPYLGERLNFGVDLASGVSSWAEEKLVDFPIGKQVKVFYNPDKPSEAVLEKSAPMGKTLRVILVFAILGSLVMAASLYLMFALLNTPS